MVEFQNPDMLLGLLIILPLAAVSLFLTRTRARAWRIYAIVLPLFAAALALLAAAQPVIHISTSAKRVIVALDNSPAAITAPWHKPLWLQGFLKKHMPHDVHITLVTFASRPHVIASGVIPAQLPARNIPLTSASRAPASTKRLLTFAASTPCWIFTSGLLHWQLPDHATSPAAPIAATVIPPPNTDVGITHLQLVYGHFIAPQHLHRTSVAPLPQLQITVRSTGPVTTTLVERCGTQNLVQTPLYFPHSGMKMVLLPPLPRRIISAHQTITVTLNSHDLWPGDNSARIRIPVPGLPRVLIVTNHPTMQPSKVPQWIAQRVSPAEFPDSLHTLENFQAVVLDNIAIRDLPIRAEQALSAYVTNIGGGLLITGTHNAFGPGGYALPQGASGAPSLLENLSPLSSLPPNPKPQHIVFLMDVSGSLGNPTASGVTRFALAAHAVCAAVQLLKPKDRITILLFSGSTRKLVNGEAQAIRPLLPKLLATIVPNGPTRPNSALPALQHLLTSKALLILVTDGRIPHLNLPAWKKLLLRDAVHLTVIAPGHSSRATKQLLAQTEAKRLPMQHFSQWGQFLRAAVARHIDGKAETTTTPWASRTLHQYGQTDLWDRVYLKPGTTLLANSHQHPLAALWRRGLGQVAAICFSDNSPAADALRSTLLNMVKAPAGNLHFYISAIRRNNHWCIAVQAIHNGQFLNQRQLGLTATPQHGNVRTIPLPQIAPGQYRATLPDNVQAFAATVWQVTGQGTQKHQDIIGHISPPLLPNRYFPATGHIQQCPWPKATSIPANSPPPLRWNPISTNAFALADVLWLQAALTALAAIVLARIYT